MKAVLVPQVELKKGYRIKHRIVKKVWATNLIVRVTRTCWGFSRVVGEIEVLADEFATGKVEAFLDRLGVIQ